MCNITINPPIASQVTGSTADKITVSGTVRDCPQNPPNPQRPDDEVWVDVTATVLVNGAPDPTQSTGQTVSLPVVPAGTLQTWNIELKDFHVPCGTTIRVRATCHTDASCFFEQDFTINCGCPSATLSVPVPPNCNANGDGTRTATFSIDLTNLPAGTPVFGTLHLGSGVPGPGTISVQFDPSAPGPVWTAQPGGFVGQFSFDYQPGTYNNVSFEMTFPTACHISVPLGIGALNIGVCPVTNCPTALTIEVSNSTNPNLPVPTGPDDPCLPAGDYIIKVTQPDPVGRTYTWSVDIHDGNGSQVDNGPNVNGLNRNTYNRTIVAGSTTTVSVSVSTPLCEIDPPPGVVELRACTSDDVVDTLLPPWCPILKFIVALALMVALVSVVATGCSILLPAAVPTLVVAVGVTIVVGLLWLLICAPGVCALLGVLVWALKWAIVLGALIAIGCGSFVSAFIVVLYGGIVAALIWVLIARGCRIPRLFGPP